MEEKAISKAKKSRVNKEINAPSVRLIDAEGGQKGIVNLADALRLAEESNLDLVEVSPNAEPPVCRIMDFGKYRFQHKSKQKANKKQRRQNKEMKFRPVTDVGDYQIKMRKIMAFLQNGDTVRITVRFRGREMMHQQLGLDLLKRVEADAQEICIIDQMPKLEGRQLMMVLRPKKS